MLTLNEFKRTAVPFLDRGALQNAWDVLAIAQHYGLPTRLIDWTTNPLVAAFFASEHSQRSRREGEIIAVHAHEVGYYRPDDADETDPFAIGEAGFLRTLQSQLES